MWQRGGGGAGARFITSDPRPIRFLIPNPNDPILMTISEPDPTPGGWRRLVAYGGFRVTGSRRMVQKKKAHLWGRDVPLNSMWMPRNKVEREQNSRATMRIQVRADGAQDISVANRNAPDKRSSTESLSCCIRPRRRGFVFGSTVTKRYACCGEQSVAVSNLGRCIHSMMVYSASRSIRSLIAM